MDDHQEEDYAQEIINKHDDDADGNRIALNLIKGMGPTDFVRPKIEDE